MVKSIKNHLVSGSWSGLLLLEGEKNVCGTSTVDKKIGIRMRAVRKAKWRCDTRSSV